MPSRKNQTLSALVVPIEGAPLGMLATHADEVNAALLGFQARRADRGRCPQTSGGPGLDHHVGAGATAVPIRQSAGYD
jgi:hypothetical protein